MPYQKNGIKYPRCTEIIGDCSKGPPLQWAANCAVEWIDGECEFHSHNYETGEPFPHYIVTEEDLNKARFAYKTVSDKALDVGSEVHDYIEKYFKTGKKKSCTIDQIASAIDAFHRWEDEHNLKPIELEKTVYGGRWAGTLDFYGYFDGKLYVIDWKTSKPRYKKTGKGIYPEMRYQVAAYRSVIEQTDYEDYTEFGDPFGNLIGCGVLRLDKETGMPDWNDTSKTYEQDLRIFNRMVDLYFERHPKIAKRFEGAA